MNRCSPRDEPLSKYGHLWVPPTASMEEIQQRFKNLALLIHPDKRGDTKRIKIMNEINCVLLDDGARNIYKTHKQKFAVESLS